MFAEPTYEIFKSWIGHHLAKASAETGEAILSVKAKMNAAGAYRSGRTFLQIFAQVDVGLEKGLTTALGELKRAIRITKLQPAELRRITEQELRAFVDDLKGMSNATELRSWSSPKSVDDGIAKLDRDLQFALDHFDAGFLDPAEPELPTAMTNTINIGSMSNSAVQQGTSHSTLEQINVDAAKQALEVFQTEFAKLAMTANQHANIDADAATLKAQLAKPTRSDLIIRETARSLRSVTEGIVAGALTDPAKTAAHAAASMLWTALGIG